MMTSSNWLRNARHPEDHPSPGDPCPPEGAGRSLSEAQPGSEVKVCGFNQSLSLKHRMQLQAYGLVPGYFVRVLRQNPLTIIQIENTELALEKELAQGIWVV